LGKLPEIGSKTNIGNSGMKKSGILNSHISSIIASMGHLDHITICDAGFPIPKDVERIDLALIPGEPDFLSVLRAIANDLEVERIILAEEIKELNPMIEKELLKRFEDIEVGYQPHADFKVLSQTSRAIIRTGECTPYANVILISGVTF
jgi:D-ribose pyranase